MATITYFDNLRDMGGCLCEIPDELVDELECAGYSVSEASKSRKNYFIELENQTDAGLTMTHTLAISVEDIMDLKEWYRAFFRAYEAFDAFEEAVKWCDSKGRPHNKAFRRGTEVYNDIHCYELDILTPTVDELHRLALERM